MFSNDEGFFLLLDGFYVLAHTMAFLCKRGEISRTFGRLYLLPLVSPAHSQQTKNERLLDMLMLMSEIRDSFSFCTRVLGRYWFSKADGRGHIGYWRRSKFLGLKTPPRLCLSGHQGSGGDWVGLYECLAAAAQSDKKEDPTDLIIITEPTNHSISEIYVLQKT